MAIEIIKEVNRSAGRAPHASNTVIIAGQPVEIVSSDDKLQPYSGSGTTSPYGLAADSTKTFPLQGTGGLTAGFGFDYTNFNRGGLIAVYLNGGEFHLFDDGNGAPFNTSDSFTVNGLCYVDSSGLIRSSSASAYQVGVVTKVVGSAPVTDLYIKSTL